MVRAAFRGSLVSPEDSSTILFLATGSDFCAEHEQGCAPLIDKLCQRLFQRRIANYVEEMKRLNKRPLLKKILEFFNKLPKAPSFLDKVRIQNVDNVYWQEAGNKAYMYSGPYLKERMAQLAQGVFPLEYAPTSQNFRFWWDSDSFVIEAEGPEIVRLKKFYSQLQAGKVIFAGKVVPHSYLISGLVFGDEEAMRANPDSAEWLKNGEQEYHKELELKILSEESVLNKELGALRALSVSHFYASVHARWTPEDAGPGVDPVSYSLQVSSDVLKRPLATPFFEQTGLYTAQDIRNWIRQCQEEADVPSGK